MMIEELNNIIGITEQAKNFFIRRNIKEIFLSITPNGCSGFSYKIEEKREDIGEFILNKKEDFNIYIHKKAISYYNNAIIDIEKNIFEEKIIFKNPNIKDSCGCGESFNIK